MLLKLLDNFILNTNHIVSIVKNHQDNGNVIVEINMVKSTIAVDGPFTYEAKTEKEADDFIEIILTNS